MTLSTKTLDSIRAFNVRILISVFALIAMTTTNTNLSHAKDQNIINTPTSDTRMNLARKTAQKTLPEFWKVFNARKSGETKFVLKIAMPTSKGSLEHIWANQITRAGKEISGTLNNTPRDIPGAQMGQKIKIPSVQISDWGYVKNGKMHGYFTVRALLHRLPKAQATYFRSVLAPATAR